MEIHAIEGNPRVKRDLETKMSEFFTKLKNREFDEFTMKTVVEMSSAVGAREWGHAKTARLSLVETSWTGNDRWLNAAKEVISKNEQADN